MSSNRPSNQIRIPSNKDYSVATKEAHRLQLLHKRRESDAKCRANLTFSFEQLKLQVLDESTINTRVSREMILHETLSKIQYLEGVLVLLDQTKDKQEGRYTYRKKSTGARLDALHREFGKSYNSSTHGNKKPKEKPMSQQLPIYRTTSTKMILPSQTSNMLPKMTQSTSGNSMSEELKDQVVPKPSPQILVKDSPPHTIIVPYIGRNNDYGSQEVPVCFSPNLQMMDSSPEGTPTRRYKIKGSTIKCVSMDDFSWNNADWETSEDDSMDSNSVEPDLTCKEEFPYWLEEADRNERSMRTETPLKPMNTSQMTYPYPMAPRKSKNTAWSAKYMEQLYEDDASEEANRQRPKRLFAEMGASRRSPYQHVHYVRANSDIKPKRHYRKLCTAARVRPYNHITGKVESSCKGYKNMRAITKRKGSKSRADPEFCLNSYYKRKMKKDDVGSSNITIAVPARHQSKHTGSPEIHDGVDIMEDWMRKEEERQKETNADAPPKPDDEINSQHSLVLTDVPHLPEDIVSPLDIDDEGIVDTILELEESSMPPMDLLLQDGRSSARPMELSKATLQEGYFDADQDIWNPDSDDDFFEKECSDEIPSDDAITPSLAAYACMALSNMAKNKSSLCNTTPSKPYGARTAPIMSPVVYYSPVKQTPITRSNPTLSSTLLAADEADQVANTTKEAYSDFSFASPLSTSSLFSNIGPALVIDVDNIKDIKEVQFDGAAGKDHDADMWDIDKMMEINSSLDELIDREVFLCSPKVIPRSFMPGGFMLDSQDVEVPCGDAAKMATPGNPDAMDQLLPSSWKSKGSVSNHLSSQDSMLEYQVVPNFLPSEDDGEILDLRLRLEDLSEVL